MATLAQIRDAADSRLTVLWGRIVTRQEAYFATHGRYWQGLLTHSAIPQDGARTAPDRLDAAPTDQGRPWSAAFAGDLDLTEPLALRVDVYEGPLGQGFVGRVFVRTAAGVVWTRAQGYGPHADEYTHGWQAVEAEGV